MNKSFTLVELLVVIAILGILASMLTPALKKARIVAESTVCLNKLRELGIAAQLYADDNAGIYVVSSDSWWTSMMYKGNYLEMKESVMTCPSLAFEGDWLNGSHKFSKYYYTYGVARDYKRNPRPGYKKANDPGSTTVTLSQVLSPRKFFYYADSARETDGKITQILAFEWHGNTKTGGIHTRHNEKANIWFLDGHTESLDSYDLRELGIFGGWTEDQVQIKF